MEPENDKRPERDGQSNKSVGARNDCKSVHYELVNCRKEPLVTAKASFAGREIYIHSPYDPEREAGRAVDAEDLGPGSRVLLFGFGLGYLAKELLVRLGPEGTLVAVQWDEKLTDLARRQAFVVEIFKDPRFTLIEESEEADIVRRIRHISGIEDYRLIIHRPLSEVMPASMSQLQAMLQDFNIHKQSVVYFQQELQENTGYFLNHVNDFLPAHLLFGRFPMMPIVIVSAGPSLDALFPQLREISGQALIISVGTALKPLLEEGIEPHLVIVTDPQERVWTQLDGVEQKFPLIVLPTVAQKVMRNWHGPKLAAIQEGVSCLESLARAWHAPLVKTGGSVATTALDFAIRLDGNPIILVGQDLAYIDGYTHSTKVVQKNIKAPITDKTVLSVTGQYIPTTHKLMLYKRWLERRIEEEPNKAIINASPTGARINGTLKMTLAEVKKKFLGQEHAFRNVIDDALAKNSPAGR